MKPIASVCVLLVALAICPVYGRASLPTYNVTIEDDCSYPQFSDYDYGLESADIEFSNDHPCPGETVTITAHVRNYGLCTANSPWGFWSPTGRSCWGEWDFYYPASGTVDISYRCWDQDATVDWRVELDGVHIADASVPKSVDGQCFKLVTIHDVSIQEGWHTIFLGTYQMDFYPDYILDWVEVGEVHIEGETYDRTGGNATPLDWRGLTTSPRCPRCPDPSPLSELTIQIWSGDPAAGGTLLCEDCVGQPQEVNDYHQCWPGQGPYTAHYIENNGQAPLICDWTPTAPGAQEIYVVVDPHGGLTEIDETNNVVQRAVEVTSCADIDIKPGSCPNPLNRNSHGVLPVALVGSANFDATMVNVSSVRLSRADGVGGEVAPNEGPPGPHSVFADVATPFDGEPGDCHELEGDGIVDLSMKFRTDQVVAALQLNEVDYGELELIVTGQLLDGTEFTSAGDCIRLVPPRVPGPDQSRLSVESNLDDAWVEVEPLDLTLDGGGFADFERVYNQGTVITLTAPGSADGRTFRAWEIDGVMQTAGQTVVEMTIVGDVTARARYRSQTLKQPGLGGHDGSPVLLER